MTLQNYEILLGLGLFLICKICFVYLCCRDAKFCVSTTPKPLIPHDFLLIFLPVRIPHAQQIHARGHAAHVQGGGSL